MHMHTETVAHTPSGRTCGLRDDGGANLVPQRAHGPRWRPHKHDRPRCAGECIGEGRVLCARACASATCTRRRQTRVYTAAVYARVRSSAPDAWPQPAHTASHEDPSAICMRGGRPAAVSRRRAMCGHAHTAPATAATPVPPQSTARSRSCCCWSRRGPRRTRPPCGCTPRWRVGPRASPSRRTAPGGAGQDGWALEWRRQRQRRQARQRMQRGTICPIMRGGAAQLALARAIPPPTPTVPHSTHAHGRPPTSRSLPNVSYAHRRMDRITLTAAIPLFAMRILRTMRVAPIARPYSSRFENVPAGAGPDMIALSRDCVFGLATAGSRRLRATGFR